MYEQYACRGSVPSSILRSGSASRPAVTQFEPLFGSSEKLETLNSPCELHQRPQMRCSFISNSIKSNAGAGIKSMRCIAYPVPSLSVRIVTNSEPLALQRKAQSTFDAARRNKLFWAERTTGIGQWKCDKNDSPCTYSLEFVDRSRMAHN